MIPQPIYYSKVISTFLTNGSLIIQPHCNAITIVNVGLTVALVDTAIPLNPGVPGVNNGESISFGGNLGEVFKGRIDISFPVANGKVIVIQKVYLP